MKRILRGILIGGLITVLAAIPVLAAYYSYIDVTESNGTSYTNLAMNVSLNCSYLAANGYITANGTDTRVTASDYYVLPHMLAEDRLLWVGDLPASNTTRFFLYTGQSALESFPIITGYGGYVTINDTDDLEPGDMFAFCVSGYVDTSTGANKSIIRKGGALSFNVTDNGEVTFAIDGGTSVVASGVNSGYHTFVVYSEGLNLRMEVDGVEVDTALTSNITDTDADWYLFENNVMPYVYYYGEWVMSI